MIERSHNIMAALGVGVEGLFVLAGKREVALVVFAFTFLWIGATIAIDRFVVGETGVSW